MNAQKSAQSQTELVTGKYPRIHWKKEKKRQKRYKLLAVMVSLIVEDPTTAVPVVAGQVSSCVQGLIAGGNVAEPNK